jgi:hypothetical protein
MVVLFVVMLQRWGRSHDARQDRARPVSQPAVEGRRGGSDD